MIQAVLSSHPRACKPWFPNCGSRLPAEQRLNWAKRWLKTGRKKQPKDEVLGRIFMGHQGPRPRDFVDKNFLQVALFCCVREGVAGMCRDLGRDVPDFENILRKRTLGWFLFPIKRGKNQEWKSWPGPIEKLEKGFQKGGLVEFCKQLFSSQEYGFWERKLPQKWPSLSLKSPLLIQGELFYLQLELFFLQLSFFAYSPLRPLLDALSHCKQKSSNCKQRS